jgi:hypothetical protein
MKGVLQALLTLFLITTLVEVVSSEPFIYVLRAADLIISLLSLHLCGFVEHFFLQSPGPLVVNLIF